MKVDVMVVTRGNGKKQAVAVCPACGLVNAVVYSASRRLFSLARHRGGSGKCSSLDQGRLHGELAAAARREDVAAAISGLGKAARKHEESLWLAVHFEQTLCAIFGCEAERRGLDAADLSRITGIVERRTRLVLKGLEYAIDIEETALLADACGISVESAAGRAYLLMRKMLDEQTARGPRLKRVSYEETRARLADEHSK